MQLRIRNAVPQDAAALLEIYGPYVVETAITYEYDVPSADEFQSRIISTLEKFPYLVAEDLEDGRILGYCYAGTFHARKAYDCSAELSIYIRRDCHGQGLGRQLYAELEKRLKENGRTTLYACIAATSRENDPYLTNASILFHEKMGYKLAGRFTRCAVKFGQEYDMVYMEKHL